MAPELLTTVFVTSAEGSLETLLEGRRIGNGFLPARARARAGGRGGKKGAGHGGDEGQPIDHEGSRIVDETFALEDTHDRSRNAQRAHDRENGYRVRG